MKRTAYAWLSSRPFLWQLSRFFLLERECPFNTASCPWTIGFSITSSYVDLAKAVLVGFGAALLGILTSRQFFAEARYSFERLRDSRSAYSEAKTGIDYLPLRLCSLDLKAAAAFVQRAHVRKHEAELYPELKFHLKKRGIDKTPEQWGDGIYSQLFDVRELLEAHAGDWDSLRPDARPRAVER